MRIIALAGWLWVLSVTLAVSAAHAAGPDTAPTIQIEDVERFYRLYDAAGGHPKIGTTLRFPKCRGGSTRFGDRAIGPEGSWRERELPSFCGKQRNEITDEVLTEAQRRAWELIDELRRARPPVRPGG